MLLAAGACPRLWPEVGLGLPERLQPCARRSACPRPVREPQPNWNKPRTRAARTELCPKPEVPCHSLTSLRIPGSPRDAATALTGTPGSGPRPPPPLSRCVTVAEGEGETGKEGGRIGRPWRRQRRGARSSPAPSAILASRYHRRDRCDLRRQRRGWAR